MCTVKDVACNDKPIEIYHPMLQFLLVLWIFLACFSSLFFTNYSFINLVQAEAVFCERKKCDKSTKNGPISSKMQIVKVS